MSKEMNRRRLDQKMMARSRERIWVREKAEARERETQKGRIPGLP
jgi:hypothetical protein